MINFIAMNLSERWATRRGRIQIILIALILATLPFYCAGLIILMIDPQPGGSATPTVISLTGTPSASPTTTPPTLVYFLSPTITTTGTITTTPTITKTFAIPPTITFTATLSPVPSNTPTLEPSPTETPNPTDTPTILNTETPSPTP